MGVTRWGFTPWQKGRSRAIVVRRAIEPDPRKQANMTAETKAGGAIPIGFLDGSPSQPTKKATAHIAEMR